MNISNVPKIGYQAGVNISILQQNETINTPLAVKPFMKSKMQEVYNEFENKSPIVLKAAINVLKNTTILRPYLSE